MIQLEQEYWARLFDKLVNEAERRFGPADKRFRFKGLTPDSRGPQIIFDQPGGYEISLLVNFSDKNQGKFQLAHEAIHFLMPENDPPAELITSAGNYPSDIP